MLLCIATMALVAGPASGATTLENVAETLNQPGATGTMSKSLSLILLLGVPVGLLLAAWIWVHNGLVNREEAVYETWAQVESNFQRRAELIPALVDTVSRYLQHETRTLTQVIQARSALPGREVLEHPEQLEQIDATETALRREIHRLLVIAEDYPELRSSDQFLQLQAQLEGTENRINVARMRFNTAVSRYNAAIRRLPGNLIAAAGGFRRKAYFQSDAGHEQAPELRFD
ncbi:MAG: LemA family protein [Candidatus Competibacterales bacterium]|nr:LemA family protein [Candidatus Competibacterales bacterium]